MKRVILSLSLIATFVLGVENNTTATKDVNKSAPKAETQKVLTFNFKAVDGTEIKVQEMKNGLKYLNFPDKNVILFLYIYDGAPCQKELEIFKKYKEQNKDVEIIAVELKGLDKDKLLKYSQDKKLNFYNVVGKDAMNFVQYIAYRAQWQGTVPFIIITDKNGEVKYINVGLMNKDQLDKVLKK